MPRRTLVAAAEPPERPRAEFVEYGGVTTAATLVTKMLVAYGFDVNPWQGSVIRAAYARSPLYAESTTGPATTATVDVIIGEFA